MISLPRASVISAADVRLCETNDLALAYLVAHRLFFAEYALVEEHALFVPSGEAAVDDLFPSSFGLALALGDLEQRGPLTLGEFCGNLFATECDRLGEGDVQRDFVEDARVDAGALDDDRVDPTTILHVDVRVEHIARSGLEAHHGADLDVLL